VVEGADLGRSFELRNEGEIYVVGRVGTCALCLTDKDVSREHIQLVRRGGGVLVLDLGAKNRAILGDTPIPTDRFVPWKRPWMLRLGTSVLSLTEPVAAALAELESSEDESLPEEGAPPPPPPSSAETQAGGGAGGAAPLAAPPVAPEAPPAPTSVGWSSTDLAVGAAAALVIALSAIGLYWLFKT
jgi:hypothetical protein